MFFFHDTATTEIYTLSLHDALPIFVRPPREPVRKQNGDRVATRAERAAVVDALRPRVVDADGPESRLHGLREAQNNTRRRDRKSTRLNSSHANTSYAAFCLKKNHSL